MAFYVNISEGTCRSTPYPNNIEATIVEDAIGNAFLYGVTINNTIVKMIDYNGISKTIYNIDE